MTAMARVRGDVNLRGPEVDLIVGAMGRAIGAKTVTYDFERLMDGATLLSCSEFGDAMIAEMD